MKLGQVCKQIYRKVILDIWNISFQLTVECTRLIVIIHQLQQIFDNYYFVGQILKKKTKESCIYFVKKKKTKHLKNQFIAYAFAYRLKNKKERP